MVKSPAYRNGEGEDEDPGEGAAAPDDLAEQSLWIEVVSNLRRGRVSLSLIELNLPDITVVRVIRPHQNDSTKVQL